MVSTARVYYAKGLGFDPRQIQEILTRSLLLFGGLANYQEYLLIRKSIKLSFGTGVKS